MLLSVRNKVFNEIIAALDVIDEEEIRMRAGSETTVPQEDACRPTATSGEPAHAG